MGKAYLGFKTGAGLCQAIIGMIPRHDLFLESYLGSGVVMKRKSPALHVIGIYVNAKAISDFS